MPDKLATHFADACFIAPIKSMDNGPLIGELPPADA
jgi:hypothetical protein